MLSVSSSANNAFAQTADEAVLTVENHYRELADMSAKVVQKNFLKSMGKTQKFEGLLFIKKPGKLRLEYANGQIVVINNKKIWFYSKKSEQVIIKTFTDIEQMNIPVAFLLGAGDIKADFEVRRPDVKAPRALDLIPRKPGAAMKKLTIWSDEAGRITAMTIYDKSGNTSDITFTEVKENAGVDDSLFKFKVPKGTEIIEQ